MRLQLGRDAANAVEVAEPLARLLLRLPARLPAGAAGVLGAADDWLFTGRYPGRPQHPLTLGKRLKALGMPPRPTRNTALHHLAQHVPPGVLADLLGLHIHTTERWAAAAGASWTSYAAARSRSET